MGASSGAADAEEGGVGGTGKRKKATRRIRSESVVAKMVRPEKYPRSLPSLMYILSLRQLHKVTKSRDEIVAMLVRNVSRSACSVCRRWNATIDPVHPLTDSIRFPTINYAQVVVAIFHGTLYLGLSPGAIQSRLSLLFFAIMFVMMANQSFIPKCVLSCLPACLPAPAFLPYATLLTKTPFLVPNQTTSVFDDRLLFYRERGAGVYGSLPYWFSSSIAYVFQCAAASITYSVIVYFMSGLRPSAGACVRACVRDLLLVCGVENDHRTGQRTCLCFSHHIHQTTTEAFGYFVLVVTTCGLCGLYFCQLVSLLAPNPQIAVSVFPAALFLVVVFAGFVVRLPSLPEWLGSWAPTASFARWAFQGMVINEFQGNPVINYYEIIPMRVEDPYKLFIENFGFEGYTKWDTLPILAICLAALWLVCYFPIRFISFEKR